MVYIVDAINRIGDISGMRQIKRVSRVGKRKTGKRATRMTKARSMKPKTSYTRASVSRKLCEGRKIRFATRRTRVFKPIMASDWQVEHQEFGIGPLKKGDLSRYGYSSNKKKKDRHMSLDKAAKKYGPTTVFRKLNALYVYNKNRDPVRSNKFMKDRDYVKKSYM
jgi:hypothetical protein